MRLTALEHLDIELGILLPDERDEVFHALGILAGQDRKYVRIRFEQLLEHLPGDRLQHGADGNRLSFEQPEVLPLLDREVADDRSTGCPCHGA